MTIVIEDGTGVIGAEVYHTREFFDDFVTSWGLGDPTGYDEELYEPAARRGTLVFDSVYGVRFNGYPLKSAQGLRFPMTGLIDSRSYSVPNLPVQVKQAAAALIWYEITTPMSLLPSVTPSKAKKFVKAGPVEVEFDITAGGSGYLAGARPILALIESLLVPLGATSVGGRALFGSAVRG